MAEMGLCRTCRWWDYHESEGLWGVCLLAETNGNDPTPYPNSKVHAFDTENYHASLVTRGDFGCIQFEARADG